MRGWGALPLEATLRLLMAVVFSEMEKMTPFTRYIHPDEMWMYRNPRHDSYVDGTQLWSLALLTPIIVAALHYAVKKDKEDAIQFLLGVSLSIGLNCLITDLIKLIIGRPRPDFFWRCFPNGEMNPEMKCTGDAEDVKEGRKSFPSGHSSISFSSLGFISYWCMGKLKVWSRTNNSGNSFKLMLPLLPLTVAMCVAMSRTCDYHHHYQDVIAGSMLGLTMSYLCYRQYYPPLDSSDCHLSNSAIQIKGKSKHCNSSCSSDSQSSPLLSNGSTECSSVTSSENTVNMEFCDNEDSKHSPQDWTKTKKSFIKWI